MERRGNNESRSPEEELVSLHAAVRNLPVSVHGFLAQFFESFLTAGDLFTTTPIRPDNTDQTASTTSSGFCTYYLVATNLLPEKSASSAAPLLSEQRASRIYSALAGAIVRDHASKKETKTGKLPNQYNSPIQAAGFLSLGKAYGLSPDQGCREALKVIRDAIVMMLLDRGGYVPRIDSTQPQDGKQVPIASPYLTFWCAEAVHLMQESLDLTVEEQQKCTEALSAVAQWSESSLAASISYLHSGVTSRFDIVEVVYGALCAFRFAAPYPEILRMAQHGLALVFSRPHFADGCFRPSAPVLANKDQFALQCSTAEAVALLLALCRNAIAEFWPPLEEAAQWLLATHKATGGWSPEGLGRHGEPTSYVTVSAVATLQGLSLLADDKLDMIARRELAVQPYFKKPRFESIPYPGELGAIIDANIIKPLCSAPRQYNLASFSMILYGPPGTSKTTIAEKVAQDLKWPFLVFGQSDFLKRGVDNIDAEADRIFGLAACLRDVVILFDEIEELVQERGTGNTDGADKLSRLLTTSMLPRLHRLRDGRRVVFILATNRVESIDGAASRLGRFDIVHSVFAPTPQERAAMLQSIFSKYGATDELRSEFEKAEFAKDADNFGYLELDAAVKWAVLKTTIGKDTLTSHLISQALDTGKNCVARMADELPKFEKMRKKYDRPKP